MLQVCGAFYNGLCFVVPWSSFNTVSSGYKSMDLLWCWKSPWPYLLRQSIKCIAATSLIEFLECIMVMLVSVRYAAIFVPAGLCTRGAITMYKLFPWLGRELVEDPA
jgi:hypothetical protein